MDSAVGPPTVDPGEGLTALAFSTRGSVSSPPVPSGDSAITPEETAQRADEPTRRSDETTLKSSEAVLTSDEPAQRADEPAQRADEPAQTPSDNAALHQDGSIQDSEGSLDSAMRARIGELEAALSARDGFLNLAAHELKTPITALQLYVDGLLRALKKGALPPEDVERRIHKVREQSVRLDRLVSSLLDVSRASALPVYPEPIDLTELSLTVIERYREEAARAKCPVDFRTGGPVFGKWDRPRLEQLLGNLLANAIQYAPGGPICVSVLQDGPVARLAVIDHGPGVVLADRARIFERFSRVGRTGPAGAFGLGLWIAKQIAESHGGVIGVSGEPGAGATFMVVLPRLREETPPEKAAPQSPR